MSAVCCNTNLDDVICRLLVTGNVNVILIWVERDVYRCADI